VSRAKSPVLALFAILIVVAAIASTASAAEWKVEGAPIGAGKSVGLAPLPKIDLSLILHFTAGTVSLLILCGAIHLIKGRILPPNMDFVERLDFLNCHTVSPTPTNCQLTGGQTTLTLIVTGAVLSLQKTSTRASFKPETGKIFTEILFKEGLACALEGAVPIKGELIAGTPTGGEERTEQGLVGLGSEENNSLEVGSGNKGFLLGKILLALATGQAWSFS
jgi:hypothetical protein